MKTLLSVLSILAVLCSSEAMAKTTLIDFGGTQNTFSSPWNLSSGQNPTLSSDRETLALKDKANVNSSVSVRYKVGGLPLVIGPPLNAHLTNLTAQQAFGTNGLAMWKQAHGVDLTTTQITNGWSETAVLGVGNLVTVGTINVGGFQANSSYTMSSAFTVSGLADILSFTGAPVTLQGSNFTLSHAYLSGSNGQIVDLLVGNVEVASLLSKGTFMMTWQFQTNASFNSSNTINMDFANGLLGLGGQYGISAMAVTDSTPNLSIPEPSSVLLGAFGFAGLMLRRRKK